MKLWTATLQYSQLPKLGHREVSGFLCARWKERQKLHIYTYEQFAKLERPLLPKAVDCSNRLWFALARYNDCV